MEIIYKTGNVLDAQTDIIAHQVNCQGVMGAGLAKQVRNKYPQAYREYQEECMFEHTINLLGKCQLIKVDDSKWIANLFGQDDYGRDKRYTNYEAIYTALSDLAVQMLDNGMESVAIPYKMSCGLAGGDWNIILAMIESPCIFGNTNITVEIWKLN